MGSRLFLYYNERRLENDIPDDAGACLSDGAKCLEKYGICPELRVSLCDSEFCELLLPKCYTDALLHKVVVAHNIANDMQHMKMAVALHFHLWLDSGGPSSHLRVLRWLNGMVPMPQPNEQ